MRTLFWIIMGACFGIACVQVAKKEHTKIEVAALKKQVSDLDFRLRLHETVAIDQSHLDNLERSFNKRMDEDIRTTTNSMAHVVSQVVRLFNQMENRVRNVEFNDHLDRAVRESLYFDIENGKVKDVLFDGGRFARAYFEEFPGGQTYHRLRITDMSPKQEFLVKEPAK